MTRRIKSAILLPARPIFIAPPKGMNAATKAGLAFERRVARYLTGMLGADAVLHGPWFKYTTGSSRKWRWCSPDILLMRPNRATLIIECKLKTTPKAEEKLRSLYLPICEAVYPKKRFRLVQIVKHLGRNWQGRVLYSLFDVFRNRSKFTTLVWNE